MNHAVAIAMLIINALIMIIHVMIVNHRIQEDELRVRKINELFKKLNLKRKVK
jgi:hypothetical protein